MSYLHLLGYLIPFCLPQSMTFCLSVCLSVNSCLFILSTCIFTCPPVSMTSCFSVSLAARSPVFIFTCMPPFLPAVLCLPASCPFSLSVYLPSCWFLFAFLFVVFPVFLPACLPASWPFGLSVDPCSSPTAGWPRSTADGGAGKRGRAAWP